MCEGRDRLRAELAEAGIEARAYYATPLHRQPAMAPYAPRIALDEVDRAAATSLALPMGPALSTEQVHEVAEVAVEILSR